MDPFQVRCSCHIRSHFLDYSLSWHSLSCLCTLLHSTSTPAGHFIVATITLLSLYAVAQRWRDALVHTYLHTKKYDQEWETYNSDM